MHTGSGGKLRLSHLEQAASRSDMPRRDVKKVLTSC